MEVKSKSSHPCYGCPYVFPIEKPSCVFGAFPGKCFWYFYNHRDNRCTEAEKQKRIQQEFESEQAKKRIADSIKMLEKVMVRKGYSKQEEEVSI